MNRNKSNIFLIGMALITIGAIYIIIGCPIKFLTGISCPGCGMTRAWMCVIDLNFNKALYYHPLWSIPLIYIFAYIFIRKKNRKLYNIMLWIFIALFIIVYIYRLFTNSEIVRISYKDGFIYKIIDYIFH